jgi:MFS family permease
MAAWGVFWGAWGALLPAVKEATGASDAALGTALLGIAAGALPALVVTGRLMDRFGQRGLVVALAGFAVACALPGQASSIAPLVAALVLLGATSGAVDVALSWRLATLEAEQGRKLFNAAHAAFPLAVVVAAPSAGLAREGGADAGAILLVVAVVCLACVPLNLRGSRERPPPRAPERRRLRPSAALVGMGALAAGVLLVENAVEQWSALHLEDTLGGSPAVGGLGPATYMAALFAGRVIAQLQAERSSGRAAVVVAGVAAAGGLALAAVAGRPGVALAGFALAGLGTAAAVPAVFSTAGASAAGGERGSAVSTVTAISYLGYLASPPLVGAVAGLGGLRAAWWVLAGCGVVIAVAAAWLWPRRRLDLAQERAHFA